jgi:hypothetical protein
MDVRQYGPALFPTLKQVRRMLDEESGARTRHDPRTGDPAGGQYDDPGAGSGK